MDDHTLPITEALGRHQGLSASSTMAMTVSAKKPLSRLAQPSKCWRC